jgi:hypothetical protein
MVGGALWFRGTPPPPKLAEYYNFLQGFSDLIPLWQKTVWILVIRSGSNCAYNSREGGGEIRGIVCAIDRLCTVAIKLYDVSTLSAFVRHLTCVMHNREAQTYVSWNRPSFFKFSLKMQWWNKRSLKFGLHADDMKVNTMEGECVYNFQVRHPVVFR